MSNIHIMSLIICCGWVFLYTIYLCDTHLWILRCKTSKLNAFTNIILPNTFTYCQILIIVHLAYIIMFGILYVYFVHLCMINPSLRICIAWNPDIVRSTWKWWSKCGFQPNFKFNKHNAELQWADPGTKVTGNSVLRVVFSHTMPKMDFRYSHRFSWEKTH